MKFAWVLIREFFVVGGYRIFFVRDVDIWYLKHLFVANI